MRHWCSQIHKVRRCRMRQPSRLELSSLSLHSHDESLPSCHAESESKRLESSATTHSREDSLMSTSARETDSLSMSALSVVLIAPDEERRRAIVQALAGPQANVASELTRYPQIDD